MKRHLLFMAVVAMALTAVGATVALAQRPDGSDRIWTAATATDEEQLTSVLRATLHARAVAARTFDVSGIVANVVDDPQVPLTDKQRAILARVDPSAESRGQLTAELAFYAFWKRGDEAFSRVAQARKLGTAPSPADVAAAMPRRSDPLYELPLTVHSVVVSGDRAYMEAETEAVYYRETFVRRGGRWFIAGEDTTSRN